MGLYFDIERLRHLVAVLAPERRTRVVEVGANPINENPYAQLRDAGLCEVWGFEPGDLAFSRLQPSENETYLKMAIGAGGTQKLHVTQHSGFTSLLRPDATTIDYLGHWSRAARVIEEVEIETRRLDDIVEVPPFDLLKIDIQGGEVQAFEGARQKLGTAQAVITEVAFIPIYEDQPLLDAQMVTLREIGFDLHKLVSVHHMGKPLLGPTGPLLARGPNRNQLVDGDAIFLRSLRRPDAIDGEQLKHLAILCDAVVESFDVVVRCLELLAARGLVAAGAAEDYVARIPERFRAK